MASADPFYFPAHEEQRPTHPRIHIQTAEEAHRLFECVRTGIFRPVIRRLNDAERAMYIRSGSVFVWEETEEAIGLRRWTDGLMWSASRMREPFLFYESKSRGRSSTNASNSDTSTGERSSMESTCDESFRSESPSQPPSSLSLFLTPHQSRGPRPNYNEVVPGLVKQTYSAIVLPGDGTRRKWHLTAYFTNADFANLPTVADDPVLSNVVVPKGMYRSGKSRQSAKSLQAEWSGSACASGSTSRVASTSAPDVTKINVPSAGSDSSRQSNDSGPVWRSGFGDDYSYTSSSSDSPTNEYPPPRRLHSSHSRAASNSSPSSPSPHSRPGSSQRSTPSLQSYSPRTYFYPSTPQPPTSPQSMLSYNPSYDSFVKIASEGSPVLPPLGHSTFSDQRYALPPGGTPMRPPMGNATYRAPEDQRMLHMFKAIP
ncbi:hypothetical protein FRB96_006602 [Tulasnella sp. 330]|nr:hypothetical protein FRB96_006602 [Tulasnella sp. 330]KAG8884647.1 hypothetical protein FRB97_003703 [Tulasnella sp. 331]KAG8889734.1 hypothetical protein FRB98_003026 [Tulasnella sp. 332]